MYSINDYRYIPDIRPSAVLTNSFVPGLVIGSNSTEAYMPGTCALKNQLILYVDFTKGSLTTAEIQIEFSNDNSTWFAETEDDIAASTGIITERNSIRTLGATGKYRIPVRINDNYIRVSAKGTGTVTGSLMTINAIIGNN
jgi:hypothetical protein